MDYKLIIKMLYDQFGDELIAYGKATLEEKVFQDKKRDTTDTKPSSDNSEANDTSSEPQPEPENVSPDVEEIIVEDLEYWDGEKFETQMVARLKGSAADAITSPAGMINAIGVLTSSVIDAYKFSEVQETKRTVIAMQRDIALARIEAQKDIMLDYMEKSFDERKENFKEFFKVVDDALEKDNMQQLAIGLESIITLAQSSPFKDLRTIEETTAALNNPDHEWDF